LAKSTGSWVDVRDVAKIHVAALQNENAGGQRYLASNGAFAWQDILDALADAGIKDTVKGKYGNGKEAEHRPAIGRKAIKELDINYHTLQQTSLDTYKSLKERFYISQ